MAHDHRCRHCAKPITHTTGEPCRLEDVYKGYRLSFVCETCLGTGAAYDWSIK